jgi:Ca2+-transporting ATPase
MAVMLVVAAAVYYLLGETRDAVVLALALIPVLGIDVLLEARSRSALDKLARKAAPFAEVVAMRISSLFRLRKLYRETCSYCVKVT